MKEYVKKQLERIFAPLAKRRDLDNLFIQLSALLEIKEVIGPGLLFGPLREWALSPDALLIILREVTSRSDPYVLEFGSGESTVAVAAALRARGCGHMVTVEHDAEFAKIVTERLRRNALMKYVDVRVVEMRHFNSRLSPTKYKSYNLANFNVDFNVALIDGPISVFGAETRAIPLEYCLQRLKGDRVIYFDDAARTDERNVLRQYLSDYSHVHVQYLETEKGLARLTDKRNSNRG